ncbi:MAG: linear amide C-N hydrolase [Actinomycetota bacterium]|nr:linear amide C-N hydrolase [Actinomycetota bacterium]
MCTNFKTKPAKDGSVVVGRSLEFPTAMPTALAVLPSDFQGSSLAVPGAVAGKSWKAKFGVVGMCGFGNPAWLLDGLNTEGLSAHLLYMPGGYCTYQLPKGDGSDVSEVDLIALLLGTCSSVAEAKQAMLSVNVVGVDPGMGFVPPIHCLVHDATASIAIEFHSDGMRILDNPMGVATNSPYLDWHLTNVQNYVGLSNQNPTGIKLDGQSFAAIGQGQGLKGLPGDYTPPARFVRALAMVELAEQAKDSRETEQLALHILNSFDIPPGLIQEEGAGGVLTDEVTVWDTIVNLTAGRFAFRTVSDPTVYVVDLARTDFTKPARTSELSWTGDFITVTV